MNDHQAALGWLTAETVHRCGCITRFDTLFWHSVTVRQCTGHAYQERAAVGAVDGEAPAT